MSPAVSRFKRTMALPTVVLPQPDSPTNAKVCPAAIARFTPSTAFTAPTWRCSRPARIGKWTCTSCTCNRGGPTCKGRAIGSRSCSGSGASSATCGQRTPSRNSPCQTGARLRQSSRTHAQRGAKRQPAMPPSSGGTCPGMVASCWLLPVISGSAVNSKRVYGWRGRCKTCSQDPLSTTWPAYMTAT